jgi:hypothetical protein
MIPVKAPAEALAGFEIDHQAAAFLHRFGHWQKVARRHAEQRVHVHLAPRQALAFHAPDQEIDAVLAEARLVFEHESRHAPMA